MIFTSNTHYTPSDVADLLKVSQAGALRLFSRLRESHGMPGPQHINTLSTTRAGVKIPGVIKAYDRAEIDAWLAVTTYKPPVIEKKSVKSVEQVLEEREIERLEGTGY